MIWRRAFWKDCAERVIASIFGGALSVIGVGVFGVLDADARTIISVALGAGLVSLFKALAASHVGDGSASLVSPGRHEA